MKKVVIICAISAICFFSLREIARIEDFQFFGGIVNHGPVDANYVALTFDDGPKPENTTKVIDILAQKNVKATFFLLGVLARKHPEALEKLIHAGHEIGNHSYSHKRMVFVTPRFARKELEKTDAVFRAAGYTGPIHFRPPYGNKLISLPYVLKQRNQKTMMWTFSPESDIGVNASAAEIAHYTIDKAKAGDIILLHPMYDHREEVRKALPEIIDGLRAKGLEPITLSKLLTPNT